MDQLFAFGNVGTDRLLKDAHPLSTWEVTDFRNELKVSCCKDLTFFQLFKVTVSQQAMLAAVWGDF